MCLKWLLTIKRIIYTLASQFSLTFTLGLVEVSLDNYGLTMSPVSDTFLSNHKHNLYLVQTNLNQSVYCSIHHSCVMSRLAEMKAFVNKQELFLSSVRALKWPRGEIQLWAKCRCVCRGHLWQLDWACLCAPIPHRWLIFRGEKTRACLSASIYLYAPPCPSSLSVFLSTRWIEPDLSAASRTNHITGHYRVKTPLLFVLMLPFTILLVFPDGSITTHGTKRRQKWQHMEMMMDVTQCFAVDFKYWTVGLPNWSLSSQNCKFYGGNQQT